MTCCFCPWAPVQIINKEMCEKVKWFYLRVQVQKYPVSVSLAGLSPVSGFIWTSSFRISLMKISQVEERWSTERRGKNSPQGLLWVFMWRLFLYACPVSPKVWTALHSQAAIAPAGAGAGVPWAAEATENMAASEHGLFVRMLMDIDVAEHFL